MGIALAGDDCPPEEQFRYVARIYPGMSEGERQQAMSKLHAYGARKRGEAGQAEFEEQQREQVERDHEDAKRRIEADQREAEERARTMGGALSVSRRKLTSPAVLEILDAMPAVYDLGHIYAHDDENTGGLDWRIKDVLGREQNALVVGQWKTGKSTLVDNMIRSLVDGDPFLARFEVMPEWNNLLGDVTDDEAAGNVCVLDTELARRLRGYQLAGQGIGRAKNVSVVSLKGRLDDFNLLDQDRFRAWAEYLEARDISTLVLDCLSPILTALELNDEG